MSQSLIPPTRMLSTRGIMIPGCRIVEKSGGKGFAGANPIFLTATKFDFGPPRPTTARH